MSSKSICKKLFFNSILAILMTLIPLTAFAASDISEHWAKEEIGKWSTKALINGYPDGNFKPNNNITRAEFFALINNVFGYEEKTKLNFSDVPNSAWYYNEIAKAAAAGYITGYPDGSIKPHAYITRQEAALVVMKAFGLSDLASLKDFAFNDANIIAPWAKNAVAVMKDKGIIKGYPDGTFLPTDYIKRAETIVLLDKASGDIYNQPGTYNVDVKGNLVVNTPNVILKDMTIARDLYLAEGIGDGEVTLEGVTVKGKTFVRGGGVNSIIIRGNSAIGTVVVARTGGAVSLKVQGDASVEAIYIDDCSDDVLLEGSFGEVEVKASNITVSTVGTNIECVTVSGNSSKVVVDKDSKIEKLNVKQGAANTSIEVAGTVSSVTTQASGTAITGSGKITNVEAKEGAFNTKIETPNTQITVDSGVTGVTGGGGVPVSGGTSGTNNNAGTGLVSTPIGGRGSGTTNVLVSNIIVSGEGNADTISEDNGNLQMAAVIEPANASNKNVTWSVISGTGEATISTAGLLTAVENGTVTVKATAKDGSGKYGEKEISITGQIPVIPTTVAVSQIDTASVEMRKGSIIMGFAFRDTNGAVITYTNAISDTYALDEDASTVALFKNGIQIGNTVKLNQLSIGDSDINGESGKVTFTDFNALLTVFGLNFGDPDNIPDKVKIVVNSKTTVAGKMVDNPWGPITYEEPVSSDLYMDSGIDPAKSSATILPGNKTVGQAFPVTITLKDSIGANLPDGNFMVEILNGATPVGGGSVAFTGGQASVNALLTSAGNHTLVIKVNNVQIETIGNVTAVSSPILGTIITTIDGSAIHLIFDKAMADPSGKHDQFTVTVNDIGNLVTAAALKPGDSNTIVLTLTTPLVGSETITIAYTQGDVAAADNGSLCTFAPMAVTNNVPPDQDGSPAFTAGTPATFGTGMTVGVGTLVVTTNLTYTWYRSDDANYNEGTDTPLGTGTAYTPVETDIGKYLIVVATSTDAAGIGAVVTDGAVEKAAGPAAIAENYVGTFPSAATTINLSNFAASASGLEAAVAVDGSNYAEYAYLAVNGEGKAVITGLAGVTASTKVKVRVKETSTHKAGAEKEIAVTVSDTTPVAPEGDLLDADSGSDFTGVLYTRAGKIYYNQADVTGAWGTETLIAGTATEGMMAVDSTGKPHVAYTTSYGKIGYRTYDGIAWSPEELIESNNGGVCSKPDIAVDNSGYAHISYTDTMGNTHWYQNKPDIMYATNASSSFVKTLIFDGYYESLGGADYIGDYFDKGSYIAVNSNGDYFIAAHNYAYSKNMSFIDRTYSIAVKSNLGTGRTASSSTDVFNAYDFDASGDALHLLYKESAFKVSQISASESVVNFAYIGSVVASSVSSVEASAEDVVTAGKNAEHLLIYYNGELLEFNDIPVKGTVVSVVYNNGIFKAVYTDSSDNLVKVLELVG